MPRPRKVGEPLDHDESERPVGRPRQFGKNMIFVTVRMPKSLERDIAELAKKQSLKAGQKVFRSDVVRFALEHYLKMEEEHEE